MKKELFFFKPGKDIRVDLEEEVVFYLHSLFFSYLGQVGVEEFVFLYRQEILLFRLFVFFKIFGSGFFPF